MTKGAIPIILHTIEQVCKHESKEFEIAVLQSTINVCQGKLDRLTVCSSLSEPKNCESKEQKVKP
jgi:hypothetical protein